MTERGEDDDLASIGSGGDDRSIATGASGDDGGDENEAHSNRREKLALKQTTLVGRLRLLTFFVLVAVAILATVGVYFYSKNDEESRFASDFSGHGLKVIQSFQDDSFRKLQALDSLSTALTRYALDTQQVWPFCTVYKSAYLLQPYLSLGGFAALNILPIVTNKQREDWEEYSVNKQGWIDDDLIALREDFGGAGSSNTSSSSSSSAEPVKRRAERVLQTFHKVHAPVGRRLQQVEAEVSSPQDHQQGVNSITPYIKNYVGIDTSPGEWIIWWQYAPVVMDRFFVNFNRLAWKGFQEEVAIVKQKVATLSKSFFFQPGLDLQSTQDFQFTDDMLRAGGFEGSYESEPLSYIHYPIFDKFGQDQKTVAVLSATIFWTSYFSGSLSENAKGIVCVVENDQGQVFTYKITGRDVLFLGMEDRHDTRYDKYELATQYSSFLSDTESAGAEQRSRYTGVAVDDEHISYSIRVYPSSEMEDYYMTILPILYAMGMLFMFVFTAGIFILYDRYVEHRQKLVMSTAEKSTAVVESLFPKTVRDRVLEEAAPKKESKKDGTISKRIQFRDVGKDKTLFDNGGGNTQSNGDVIADFFPSTTVMFTDIVGFTSWCSVREPQQVFLLLEKLYSSFDKVAKKRRIFKVETVGDCYVCVAGCPTPRADHAVAICRFARDCLYKMRHLFTSLETQLGPGTADLSMRVGISSGSVTAGVIRGQNARFQLFGDTMNVAARMESNGVPGRIHLSPTTAELLSERGKASWIEARKEKINAKGKGEMQTYFLRLDSTSSKTASSADDSLYQDLSTSVYYGEGIPSDMFDDKISRLIAWNVETLCKSLTQIMIRRTVNHRAISWNVQAMERRYNFSSSSAFDEVQEVIELPSRDPSLAPSVSVDLDVKVVGQIRGFVAKIASLYHDTPFHNFHHCTHVVQSVAKMLSRIHAPRVEDLQAGKSLHDHTYGITSDPIVQFACIFAALVHDCDHRGVSNAILVEEKTSLASHYNNKSVAEQNSVDVSWKILMDPAFADFRACIYGDDDAQLKRFRQLVVQMVLATDIVDKNLKEQRNNRWAKAFTGEALEEAAPEREILSVATNRKATIVLEHLIQASDIAHTMQHWHVYRQHNKNLFEEMYVAFKAGRAKQDPAEYWYKGEIGFFDFYIIPLAKKLKECGVFGVSSDEYLDYALSNRAEWVECGEQAVVELAEEARAKFVEVVPDNCDEDLPTLPSLHVGGVGKNRINSTASASSTFRSTSFDSSSNSNISSSETTPPGHAESIVWV